MGAIWTPGSRRAQQPQGSVELSAEYADEAVSCLLPSAGLLYDVVTGRSFSSPNVSLGAYEQGATQKHSNRAVVGWPQLEIISGGSASIVLIANPTDVRSAAYTQRSGTTTDLIDIRFREASSNTVRFAIAGQAATASVTLDGTFKTFIGTTSDANNTKLYVDGVLGGSSGRGTTIAKSSVAIAGLPDSTAIPYQRDIALLYTTQKELTLEQVQAISRNPWQIFKRRTRTIFLPVSGGTTITADGVAQQQTIEQVTLTQSHVLQPDSLYQTQGVEAVTLTQAHTLAPDALSQTQGLEAVTLTQAHIIAPDGLYQAQAIEQAAITQAHSLTPDGLAQEQATGSPALTQAQVLTPDGLAQEQRLDQVTLAVAGTLLIDSLSQTTGLTTVELVQAGVLSVDSISQEQSLATITLTQDHQLTPDDLSQTQGIEQAVLSVLNVLSIDSLSQTQGVDPATLTQAHVLQIDDLTQEQVIQAVSFGGVVVGSLQGSIRIYALLDGAIDIKPALKGNITIH